MKSSMLIGLISGVALIVIVVFSQEDISYYLNWNAFVITIGGTIAATMVYFSFTDLKYGFSAFFEIISERNTKAAHIIDVILDVNKRTLREGVNSSFDLVTVKQLPFLERGLRLVADNENPALIKEILLRDNRLITRKNNIAENVFYIAGSLAPMFGMMGTVIGLIAMLNRVKDPSAIPSAMGLALVTTLYGLILSALILKPISGKIRVKNLKDTRLRLLIIEGVLSIQRGENTQILKERLHGFLD